MICAIYTKGFTDCMFIGFAYYRLPEKKIVFNIQEDINDKDGIKIGFHRNSSGRTMAADRYFFARAQELGAEVVLNAYNTTKNRLDRWATLLNKGLTSRHNPA